MAILARHCFLFFALISLTGFHGCVNEKVHQQSVAALAGMRIAHVDTRAGTGGTFWVAGHNSPAVQVPWGMLKLGPDTLSIGKHFGKSGYHYGDVNIKGFSHTRLVGADVYEGGILRAFPSNTALSFTEASDYLPSFSHRNEVAVPGYYSVEFDSGGIQAELAATARVGLHRYTFTQTTNPVVYIDLTGHLSRFGTVKSIVTSVNGGKDQISGELVLRDDFSSRYGGLKTYFEIRLPVAATSYRFLTNTGESASVPSGDPATVFLELQFASVSQVEMRVALSYVSAAGAVSNLVNEAPIGGVAFDDVVTSTQTTWENFLGRAVATTSVTADLQKFYTALYNSARMPTIMGDYDAAQNENYTGFDGAAHTTTGFSYFSDFSLWDTFRTVHPLYLLIARTEQDHMLRSLLRMAQESGRFPRWAAGGGHADSMLGFPAAITLAESYLKGLTAFGAAAAYTLITQQASAASSLDGRECFDAYLTYGYCPFDAMSHSVSYTLEYAYADSALSSWADALGNAADADTFSSRALSYANLWNSESQAFLPKNRAGSFMNNCRLDELAYIGFNPCSKHFIEGSAAQYRWYVPQSPSGLVAQFTAGALELLETFFERAPAAIATPFPSGYYWHGNEQNLASVIFFNHLDRPDRTQYWNDWIRRTKYDTTSVGIDGNDDGGSLSSWFVLSAAGFLPVAGTDRYEIVSPLFESLTLDIAGNSLVITSTGASTGKKYVRGATLNGTPLPNPRFTHSQIATGGTLVFNMSETPGAWQ